MNEVLFVGRQNAFFGDLFTVLKPSRSHLLMIAKVFVAIAFGLFLVLRFYAVRELLAAFILFCGLCTLLGLLALSLFVMYAIGQVLFFKQSGEIHFAHLVLSLGLINSDSQNEKRIR